MTDPLTPIHIKGKKRKRNLSVVDNVDPVSATSSPRAKAGRPKTAFSQASYAESSAAPNLIDGTEQMLAGSLHLSPLERLPVELLEDIFLDSLNMDLPLVSSTLLGKLSRRTLFHSIFLGIIKDQEQGDSKAQSDLFRRRFISMKLLEEMKSRKLLPLKRTFALTPDTIDLSDFWGEHYTDDDWLNYQDVRDLAFYCAEGTDLPARVFNSSNKEWQNLFRQLVYAGAKIDWVNTATGELATKAFENAIKAGDHEFLYNLNDGVGLICTLDHICIGVKNYLSTDPVKADNAYHCLNAMSDMIDDDVEDQIPHSDCLWQLCADQRQFESLNHRPDRRGDWLLQVLCGYQALNSVKKPTHMPDPYP